MNDIIVFENLKDLILELRGEGVLLDSDIAQIYGVETRDINKAVTNNPDKFPAGYVIELSKQEKNELVENFHRFRKLKHSAVNPKAFPEKGLYMLATILKSPKAVQATLAIIETFAKIRQLSRSIQREKGTVLFFHKTSAAKATHYWIPDQVGDDKGYVGNGRERSLRAKKEIYRWFNLQD